MSTAATHSDYVVTTKGKPCVHRTSCKRATDARALAELNPPQLNGLIPASCCKPSAVKVAEALLTLSAERDAAPAEVTVAYEDSGAPKHYWRLLCR